LWPGMHFGIESGCPGGSGQFRVDHKLSLE
jgi:hypothetical protein